MKKKTIGLFGKELTIKDKTNANDSKVEYGPENIVSETIETLRAYMTGKAALDNKIIENDKWYKSNHWDLINFEGGSQDNKREGEPEPVSGYLFNMLANKHADFMDNYPEANMLPQEEDDVEEAEKLTSIMPTINKDYRKVYSDASWNKLKHGFSIQSVVYDPDADHGLGASVTKVLDPLRVYWKNGINDIQKSPKIFVLDVVEIADLEEEYPDMVFGTDNTLMPKTVATTDPLNTDTECVVVDCYYKKGGKLHFIKIASDNLLFSSEQMPEYENGFYAHGEYPIVIDVLFPEDNSPVGFGYIDVVKNPQIYIDKLDQIIMKNALLCGKTRYFTKGDGINEDEFMDYSKDLVHVNGTITDEYIREIIVKPIDNFIVNHRDSKKMELKEISGVDVFNTGQGGKGVTAASAIYALQEAGNKLSRDMIDMTYLAFTKITYLNIEIIREFYSEPRTFRTKEPDGKFKFNKYDNSKLKQQETTPEEERAEGYEPTYRKAYFDIDVQPEKQNPFSRAVHNELAKEMFNSGFFNPQRALETKAALKMMRFEGKEDILQVIEENSMVMQQMQQMQEAIAKMTAVIGQLTNRNVAQDDEQALVNQYAGGGMNG